MDWKYWATDLLENGIETPGIIQLAGEDLDLFPTEFTELLDTVFKELDVEINQEAAYCSYVLGIAEEVIRGERTARSGLRTDNVNEWTHQFFEKLVKANEKYCTTFYQG
ncbi:MAG: hypothetical protein IJL42_08195 [Bacteroidales bacterium]|nr:hypothetical protein [Bacteroidales bacterium]